jgi:hypothetical protein
MSQIRCQDRKHFPQVLLLVNPCFQAVDGDRASQVSQPWLTAHAVNPRDSHAAADTLEGSE